MITRIKSLKCDQLSEDAPPTENGFKKQNETVLKNTDIDICS